MVFSDSERAKLGSDSDPIRQGLFASQSMKELLQHVKLDGSASPFQTIADAAKLADEGKQEEARKLLRSVVSIPGIEARIHLWAWSALRELSEQPDPTLATEILGVVVEVPMKGAYDTLAAYQDGSARYLNFSGQAIFWDAPDSTVKGLCLALLNSTVPASVGAKPRTDISLPKSGAQVTLLTRSGMFVITNLPQTVGKAAEGLMIELIRRASARRSRAAGAGN